MNNFLFNLVLQLQFSCLTPSVVLLLHGRAPSSLGSALAIRLGRFEWMNVQMAMQMNRGLVEVLLLGAISLILLRELLAVENGSTFILRAHALSRSVGIGELRGPQLKLWLGIGIIASDLFMVVEHIQIHAESVLPSVCIEFLFKHLELSFKFPIIDSQYALEIIGYKFDW